MTVRLRFGPGVPDAALLNPRPVDPAPGPQPRRARRWLAWLAASVPVALAGAAAAWWLLLR
ncbi:MAG: hypothetical protein IRY85_08500 [Micromonosporaceae bacterium]|nr:hypothetical protein [Micromonosporaceae bacterium]